MKDQNDLIAIDKIDVIEGDGSISAEGETTISPASLHASDATERTHTESKTDKQVLASVVIPYSKPKTVGASIATVINQDYPNEQVEIIVVGKGTSELQARFPQIEIVDTHQKLSPGRARNAGAAIAKGEFILFLDDDCEAQNGWISENLAELADPAVGAVSGQILGKSPRVFARSTDYANFGACRSNTRRVSRLWTATLGIRRELFERLGGFDESLRVQEDIDLCFQLNRLGFETIHQPKIKVLHNHGRDSIGSYLSYQYGNGRSAGLDVESRYPDLGFRNRLLSKLGNPVLYLAAAMPFSLLGTAFTVKDNFRADPEVIFFSPLIFVGKLLGHLGTASALLDQTLRSSWNRSGIIRGVSTLFRYAFLKSRITSPRVLTLYVTSACNAKCKHCFYWKNLNQKSDLSFGEMVELSESIGKLDKLLIGGGEPFLRRELPQICEQFIRQNDAQIVSIPTNGLTPKLISRQAKAILDVSQGRALRINLSLDGTESVHDDIRQVPGNFKQVVETYRQLKLLQGEYPNLTIGINSCIMDANYSNLYDLIDEFPELFPEVDMPGLILLRGDPYEPELKLPSLNDLKALHSHKRKVAASRQSLLWKIADWANFRIGLRTIQTQSQAVSCEAGRILGVVEDNGDVRHCELLPPIGNLRENNFVEIWNSETSVAAREKIVRGECYCTHECNVFESLLAHPVQGIGAALRARA